MTAPKITIGTRAYNSQKYMRKCIESVLKQTFTDFEYIIIDNGSTDQTGEIIDEYAQLDKRIKVIHLEKNDPAFSLTKILVEQGQGEFFMDFDSDDWLEENFIEELYGNILIHNVDIAICGSEFYFEEDNSKTYRKAEDSIIISQRDIPTVFPNIYQFLRTTWGKIEKADIVKSSWKERNNSGYKALTYGGDTYFCFEFLKRSKGIYLSNKVLHHYLVHKQSSSFTFDEGRLFSDKFLFYHAKNFLEGFGEISENNYKMIYLVYACALIDTLNVIFNSNLNIEEQFIEVEKIFNDKLTKKLLYKYELALETAELKRQVAVYICKNSTKDNLKNKLIYENIIKISCDLNSDIKKYDLNIILFPIANKFSILLCYLILKRYDEIIVAIENGEKDNILLFDLKFILEFEKTDKFDEKISLCENYLKKVGKNDVIKSKILKLIKGNSVFEYCNLDEMFFMNFFELSKLILFQKYYIALELLSEYLLNNIFEGELKENGIRLFINLAALSNNEEGFIIGQKLLIEYFLSVNEYKKAKEIMQEYEKILERDEDLIESRKIISNGGGNK